MKTDSPNFAAFTEMMARVETLRKNDYETFLPSEVYGENSQLTNEPSSQLPDKPSASYKGVRLWPSSQLMKFLFDNRGTLESNPDHQYVEADAMAEEFLKENSEEILAALNKVKRREEDSVRDILAQENLHMNLEDLINLKKEEKRELKKEKDSKYEGMGIKKLKRETKAEFKKGDHSYMSLANDSSQGSNISAVNMLGRKIKNEPAFERESNISSVGPSQFMHDLDITRNRVDIAERIMMYADDENDKNPFDANTTQGMSESQISLKSGYQELIDVITNEKVDKNKQ